MLGAAGHAFGDKAGGTSGILWGLLLEGVGKGLGNTEAVTAKRLADAVQGSAQNLQGFSKAELGDKTMLDALFPFVDTLVGQVDAGARSPKRGVRLRMPAGPPRKRPHRWFRRSGGRGRWQSAALAHRIRVRSRSG